MEDGYDYILGVHNPLRLLAYLKPLKILERINVYFQCILSISIYIYM